ncbi:hypothetical protein MIND_01262500 [Mycena indigotica]|uniref:Uncharacterized protein n=1 Tax=Mycena indigotica TaxID=2126181 RepID=A0A8H6S356_9AGAR|nr:uncharacterized protein MIND_01262500 [Mycena indigotica]KAF7291191.1 hypothetical protein MIND_01262500 [Mycena indigotica]
MAVTRVIETQPAIWSGTINVELCPSIAALLHRAQQSEKVLLSLWAMDKQARLSSSASSSSQQASSRTGHNFYRKKAFAAEASPSQDEDTALAMVAEAPKTGKPQYPCGRRSRRLSLCERRFEGEPPPPEEWPLLDMHESEASNEGLRALWQVG